MNERARLRNGYGEPADRAAFAALRRAAYNERSRREER